jgi:putative modified peptide
MQHAVDMRSFVAPVVAKSRTAPFDPAVADRLLALLSTDDAFRELFQLAPHEALKQVGYRPAEGEAWLGCFFGIELASKAQIAEARSAIRNMLLSGLAQISPLLDTGLSSRLQPPGD